MILWIIGDEVYDRIVFEGEHVSFMGTDYDKVIVVNSFFQNLCHDGLENWLHYFHQSRSHGSDNKDAVLHHSLFK